MTEGDTNERKLDEPSVSDLSPADKDNESPHIVTSSLDDSFVKDSKIVDDKYHAAKSYMQQACAKGGMIVLKHGRKGKPKCRRLQCDHAVTKLFCRSGHAYKDIEISDIIAVRRGTDVDPTASSVGPMFADGTTGSSDVKGLARENSIPFLPNGKKALLDQGPVLFGSSNLRRHCDPKDMPLCLCLVTHERTLDIQFMNKKEFDEFYKHIQVLTEMNIKTEYPTNDDNRISGRSDATVANSEDAVQQQSLQALESTYYDDEFSSAIDFEFLLSQGFTEKEIIEMCEGLREEALLRSSKTAHIRSSINLQQPIDVLQELERKGVVESNASKNVDDELSEEDAAAVNAFMEQGYSEEEALQLHLQNLFVADSKKKKPAAKQVEINVNQSEEEPTIATSAYEATKGDLSV